MKKTSKINSLSGRFDIIAHRGASALCPENTIASFLLALEAKADIIELDVHLSRDDEVVVIHDNTVNRTTNGRGKVRDLGLDELKELDAGRWFARAFAGQKIPTLDEILRLPVNSAKINIELKGNLKEYPLLPFKVVEVIRKCDARKRTVVTSFNAEYLEKINELDPDQEIGEIHYMHFPHKWKSDVKNFASEINPQWIFVTRSFVERAHSVGIKVHPWTINNRFVVSRLLGMNIDGLITNDPDRLFSILKKKGIR